MGKTKKEEKVRVMEERRKEGKERGRAGGSKEERKEGRRES